jgi:hypothetical protein
MGKYLGGGIPFHRFTGLHPFTGSGEDWINPVPVAAFAGCRVRRVSKKRGKLPIDNMAVVLI